MVGSPILTHSKLVTSSGGFEDIPGFSMIFLLKGKQGYFEGS